MENIGKDERFSHISKDPRFRRIPKKDKKIKIDKRFKGMFTDKQFKIKSSVDKRGRKVTESNKEDLRRFYDVSESETSESDESVETKSADLRKKAEEKKKLKKSKEKDSNETESQSEDKVETESSSESADEDVENGPDFARGEGNVTSSSEEEEEEDDDDDGKESSKGQADKFEPKPGKSQDDEFDHNWAEMDKNVQTTEETSRRLAVCNMDWDRIKAVDIFVLLNSFVSSGGFISAVTIYPSEFGKQRMKEEQIKGPIELVEKPGKILEGDSDDDDDAEEGDSLGSHYHREKLRQYQLNRLKYYYAVVVTDSVHTANNIYTECDGMEYESSSNRLDLRFIPDDMEFDDEPKDVCSAIPINYKPSVFLTSALAQSKVSLTWDETDQERIKVTMRNPSKKEEVTEADFKAYLASDSEEEGDPYGALVARSDSEEDSEEDNEDNHIVKYKQLLQNLQEAEKSKDKKDVQMEITWEPGLKEKTEQLIKKKAETENATVWDKYLLKKKEKKKEQKIKKSGKVEPVANSKVEDNLDTSTLEAEGMDSGYQAAFSDDEVDVDTSDAFFKQNLLSDDEDTNPRPKSKGKKKKKMKHKNLTDEEIKEAEKQKAELSMLMGDEDEGKKHYNLKDLIDENKGSKKKKKKIKKKKEKGEIEEDDFKINVDDSRFSAVYSSHLYNIDPSAPEFKKTKAMEQLVDEKIKRRGVDSKDSNSRKRTKNKIDNETVDKPVAKLKKDSSFSKGGEESLDSLIKSVKSKTQNFQAKAKLKQK